MIKTFLNKINDFVTLWNEYKGDVEWHVTYQRHQANSDSKSLLANFHTRPYETDKLSIWIYLLKAISKVTLPTEDRYLWKQQNLLQMFLLLFSFFTASPKCFGVYFFLAIITI